MGIGKFLDPKNDVAFKQIFGTEKNKDILIHFLNDMIPFPGGAKIQTVTFLKPSQDPETAAKKQSIVDVLCADEKGSQYIVEMQVVSTKGFEKRAQYYAAKAYVNQMNLGDDYQNLKEIIFLAITDFVMFPDKPKYKSDHVILDRETMTHDLKDFYFSFLELPKFNKNMHELNNAIEKWAYFFKHAPETSPEDLKEIIGNDKIIGKAYEALIQFYWTEKEVVAYEEELKRRRDERAVNDQKIYEGRIEGEAIGFVKGKEEGKAEGLAEGKAEGLAEGKAEGVQTATLNIARQLLNQGMSIEAVQSATGLLPEEINTLMKELPVKI